MLALVRVELTGESVWIDLLLGLVPALLVAGAAVIAAVIARRSAIERQGEQLEHESRRQQVQLERETERQKEQLERETERQKEALAYDREMREKALLHDREMRERESSRLVLDQAVETMNSALDPFVGLRVSIRAVQAAMDEGDDQRLEAEREAARKGVVQCREAIIDLRLHDIRLFSRPNTQAICAPYEKVWETFDAQLDALRKGIDASLSEEERAAIEGMADEVSARVAAVMSAFRDWLESDG